LKKQVTSKLGQRLEELRLALGLQQNEMARAAGLNSGYLSELISGKKDNPGIENVLKIATRFNKKWSGKLYCFKNLFIAGILIFQPFYKLFKLLCILKLDG